MRARDVIDGSMRGDVPTAQGRFTDACLIAKRYTSREVRGDDGNQVHEERSIDDASNTDRRHVDIEHGAGRDVAGRRGAGSHCCCTEPRDARLR